MEIIRKGDGADWSMEVECVSNPNQSNLDWSKGSSYCHSLLKINKDDIVARRWKHNGACGVDYTIVCPVCGSIVRVDSEVIPEWLKSEAINRRRMEHEQQKQAEELRRLGEAMERQHISDFVIGLVPQDTDAVRRLSILKDRLGQEGKE